MGNIKTNFVKRVGKRLFEAYPDKFTKDYNKNKEIINEIVEIKSKKIRNTVAGYVTTLKKQQAQ
jgi:small subunit ribosomal protein S17e